MGKKYGEDLEWVLCDCDWERIGGLGVIYVPEGVGSLLEGISANANLFKKKEMLYNKHLHPSNTLYGKIPPALHYVFCVLYGVQHDFGLFRSAISLLLFPARLQE